MTQGTQTGVATITPADLHREFGEGKNTFILDVRNEAEYKDWRIEGRQPVAGLNIPYFVFLEDEDGHVARVPKDQEVTVVCAKGGASEYVAGALQQRGYKVRHLQGGMREWSELYVARKLPDVTDFTLIQYVRVAKGCLSYLFGVNGEGAVVDAGRHADKYIALAAEHGLQIMHVIDTHLHADHISGGRELAARTGARYYLPQKDAGRVTFGYEALEDGAEIELAGGEVKLRALYTPGHTIGSTSILVNNKYLMTGDTLFVESAGRPDLGGQAGDWVHHLYSSLYDVILRLPDDTVILPTHFAHGGEFDDDGIVRATLGDLRRTNRALQIKDEEAFVRYTLDDQPPQPANFATIREVNMGVQKVDEQQATEMEIGPNRCAASQERTR